MNSTYIEICNSSLIFSRRGEKVCIQPWGRDAFRVRATRNSDFYENDWALICQDDVGVITEKTSDGMKITNGKITAEVTEFGKIKFFNDKGEVLLNEYYRSFEYHIGRNWKEIDQITNAKISAREYRTTPGENSQLTVRFEANDNEKLFGMGQYQHQHLNLKGCSLELAQRNTQASVPFAVSSLGYGFLWNNPSVGRATFSKNITEWVAESAKQIDYWIVAADSPSEIVEKYANVTGKVPMMPDYAMGFWQCKLRYQTQEEVMTVAKEYKKRGIPLSVIVIDFFHWERQGDWSFDKTYWPDPEKMCKELEEMGIKVMVSVWPTVERNSVNYQEMMERDMLVRTERGISVDMEIFNNMTCFFDPTNPETRKFVWDTCKKNYIDKGVSLFWLDEAEPEYNYPQFEHYRYHMGSALEVANIYPYMYAKTFYDGLLSEGVENPISLIRCAWAGAQRFGALAWSGDVPSTYTQLKNQIQAGLNMGMAGIAWWTADIGGFHGGNVNDEAFRELLIRWFEFGSFCPVMRLHGDREPHTPPMASTGGGAISSGAPNEVWSYTPEMEKIMVHYINIREALKPYIKKAMEEAHEKGTPVIKPLFYDFPDDEECWEASEEYLFGHDILVAPVTEAKAISRKVYLPDKASWTEVATGKKYQGGQIIDAYAPLEIIPLFVKNDSDVIDKFNL